MKLNLLLLICFFAGLLCFGQTESWGEEEAVGHCTSCEEQQWWHPDLPWTLSSFQEIFAKVGIPSNLSFRLISSEVDDMDMEHLYFQQEVQGILIKHIKLHVVVQNGMCKTIHGNFIPSSWINEQEARIFVHHRINQIIREFGEVTFAWEDPSWEEDLKEITGDPEATYYPSPTPFYIPIKENGQLERYELVFQFQLRTISPDELYQISIDGQHGNIVQKINLASNCTPVQASFNSLYYGDQEISIKKRGFPFGDYALETCEPQEIETRYFEINSFGEARSWSNLNRLNFDLLELGGRYQEATTAHWSAQHAMNYLSTKVDWVNEHPLRIHVDWKNAENEFLPNARYLFDKKRHNIYVGRIEKQSLACLDIIGHEYAHAFITQTTGLEQLRQSGALNEGFADILAVLMERQFFLHSGDWNWEIGEEAKSLRSLANPHDYLLPKMYGEDDPFWFDDSEDACPTPEEGAIPFGNDYCGIHQNATIIGHWFYLLTQGGIQHSVLVRPLGMDVGEEIILRTIKYYIGPKDDFQAARRASLRATEDIFGLCSNEVAQVKNAWAAVGIGLPNNADCINILGETELCTNEPNRQYQFEAVGPFDANFEWNNIPETWSYRLHGSNQQFLTIENIPEINASFELQLVANWDGGRDTTYLLLNPVSCSGKSPRQPDPIPEFAEVRMYPNPVKSELKLFIPEGQFPAAVNIINAQGKKVFHQIINGPLTILDVSQLAEGIYMLDLRSSQGNWQGKMLKL
ncbi:MAG: M4 family metallopeptidase [Bacteroidota bacterium]